MVKTVASSGTKKAAVTGKAQAGKSSKTSIKTLRQQVLVAAPPRRSQRARVPAQSVSNEMQEFLAELDNEISMLDPGADDNDEGSGDADYIQSLEGRPAQLTTTWNIVYGPRTPQGTNFAIQCRQPGCTVPNQMIVLNALGIEQNAKSTPHGKPRKPPVCHVVPWAALETAMLNMESVRGGKFTSAFRRRVCWYDANLVPGHNGCNSAGTKTTAQTATPQELKAAETIIGRVMQEFKTEPVWET